MLVSGRLLLKKIPDAVDCPEFKNETDHDTVIPRKDVRFGFGVVLAPAMGVFVGGVDDGDSANGVGHDYFRVNQE